MKLKGIIAISGKPGLYKILSHAKNGVIVESVPEGKRTMASLNSTMSSLDDISMYTQNEELALREIMRRIAEKEDNGPAPDAKSSSDAQLKEYFEAIVPDYDRERVYPSHIRKLFHWYNLLQGASLVSKEKEDPEEQAAAQYPAVPPQRPR